jgi:hypothetical protein
MSNQTTKKDPNNRGRDEHEERFRSIWLAIMFSVKHLLISFGPAL